MLLCTLRIASAEGTIEATSTDAALAECARCRGTTRVALPNHITPLVSDG